jgi:hypothetical protein
MVQLEINIQAYPILGNSQIHTKRFKEVFIGNYAF